MKNKNSFKLEECQEIMEDENQKKQKKKLNYNDILHENNNIFICINNNKNHIKLLNNNSFFKISSLCKIIPEKNIKFKYHSELSDTDSENSSKNSLKGIDKLKERLCEESHDNNINIRKNRYKPKKINYNKFHIEKEDKSSVILSDEVKSIQSILNKDGNFIGTNYELYKMTWKNLYKWLLLFPLNILLGLLYFIYKDSYGFSFAEFFCVLLIFLVCIVSINGNEKMISKKKVNFKAENAILYLISFLCLYILICSNTNIFENMAYYFLRQYYILVHAIFFTLMTFCFVLIYLNKKMVNFYYKYSQIIESGVVLTDRS